MNWLQYIFCGALLVILSAPAYGRGDDDPPSRESDCDGLHGAAFGLCNAFCEAQDCDVEWKNSCDQLRRNFERQTGMSTFPCETGTSPTHTATSLVSPPFTPTKTPHLTATATATASMTARHTGTVTATAAMSATATASAPTATSTSAATSTATPHGTFTATNTAALSTVTATATAAGTTATMTATPAATETVPGGGSVCDGLADGAFGLCNAFCNAQDCPDNPQHPSCEVLRRNFEAQTGQSIFPCEHLLTATPTPNGATATATLTPEGGHCRCDCEGDGEVSINDLVRGVLIALGALPISDCPSFTIRDVQSIGITELVNGVRDALDGCH